jgi:tripartite-type tricarboxylate transporter receptor subunit TctC
VVPAGVRQIIAGFATACAIALIALPALAQPQYPARPIRIIVPLAAGGPSDFLARTLGQKFTEAWGQPVVIDNRPGANGVVGSELVARSAPDGYTLGMGTNGTHGINAALFAKLPYDTVNDFAPVARVGIAPYVLVAHPSLPVRAVPDLLQLARARPGQITIASGGSASQLASELFKRRASICCSSRTKAMHWRLRRCSAGKYRSCSATLRSRCRR